MRFVHLYLIGYFILLVGALAALWYGGVLHHISASLDRHRPGHRGRARGHAGDLRGEARNHSRVAPRSSTDDDRPGVERRCPAVRVFKAIRSSSPKSPDGRLACDVIASPAKACVMCRSASLVSLALCSGGPCASAACKEESGVKVTSFKFTGVKAVTDGQLKSVLATIPSSKLPWGDKHYFSREQFDADLKRIVAFYKDRGYPDARVTSFDVQAERQIRRPSRSPSPSPKGSRSRVERIVFQGFESLPEQHRHALEADLPLKPGQPLDRALLQASREAALDELKDHGFPYATRAAGGGSGHRRPPASHHAHGRARSRSRDFGPLEIEGNSSVSDSIIRRQLTFRPGQMLPTEQAAGQPAQAVQPRDCSSSPTSSPITLEQAAEIPTRVTVTEGKHRKVNFGVGYGSEEQRASGDRLAPRELLRRRAHGRRRARATRRSTAASREPHRAVFFQPQLFAVDLTGRRGTRDEPAFTSTPTAGARR